MKSLSIRMATCSACIMLAILLTSCLTPRPVVAPVAGTYNCPETVTINDQNSNAAIYYTTDGSVPTTASTKYTSPFTVSSTDTVQAIAIATGAKVSSAAKVAYTCSSTNVAQADFATSVQQRFSLAQPAQPVPFADLHPDDPNYAAAEAIYPYLHRQLLCPGCLLTSNFSANVALTRAQASIALVSILIAEQKIQLLGTADTNRVLANVPDANSVPIPARPYIATAIANRILTMQAGSSIEAMQPYSRTDMNAAFNVIQQQFNLPQIARD